jgi:hypothetical protein
MVNAAEATDPENCLDEGWLVERALITMSTLFTGVISDALLSPSPSSSG